jgi:hypothetical protein
MRKITFIVGVLLTNFLSAQTFFDNFDSYTAGQKLASQSGGAWTTWSNAPGGPEDVTVVNTNYVSPSNSLYFSSNVQNGGPEDLVRNFGVLNTGNFSLNMNMNVETGKSAYFNFQKTATIGQVWAADFTFSDNGKLRIVNQTGLNFETNFEHNVWFNFRIDINFNANIWEVFINDESRGTFANSENQIASIDIFPVNQNAPYASGFFIDDFEYFVTPYTLPELNLAATFVAITGANLSGSEVSRRVKVRNLGTSSINSFDITCNYNGQDVVKNVTGLNLASLAETTINMDGFMTLIAGQNLLTAVVSNVNGNIQDGDINDDQVTIILNPIVPAEGKIVVGEEGTGTWCGWCPRGTVAMDKMAATYGDKWIGIAVHNGDPMTVANYDAGFGALIGGYPSSLVDRGNDIDPSVMEGDFLDRITVVPTALISNSASFLPYSRVLTVHVSSNFQANASNDFKLACVLVENGVTGTTSGYNQANYYAGGANGVMGGYESKPSSVPATQMVYDYVARAIAPSFGGMTNSFPSDVNSGETHSQTFTFTLAPDWNVNKLQIIGLLIDGNGKIDNAGKIDFSSVTIEDEFFMQCPNNSELTYSELGNNLLPDFINLITGGSTCALGEITSNQSPAAGSIMNNGANLVSITSTDGCGETFSCSFEVNFNNNASIIEKDGNSIKFYPNPAKDEINFSSKFEIKSIKITSLDGKEVFSKDLNSDSGSILVSNLPIGMYSIEFKNINGNISIEKFVKQ